MISESFYLRGVPWTFELTGPSYSKTLLRKRAVYLQLLLVLELLLPNVAVAFRKKAGSVAL